MITARLTRAFSARRGEVARGSECHVVTCANQAIRKRAMGTSGEESLSMQRTISQPSLTPHVTGVA